MPNDKLGRVLAADEVGSYSMVPFGQYAGGLITLYSNVQIAYLAAGVGTAAVGGFMSAAGGLRRLGFDPQEASSGPSIPPPGALVETPAIDPGPPPSEASSAVPDGVRAVAE